jgi:hypothetical protein
LVPIQKTALATAHCLYVLEEFTFILLLIGKGYEFSPDFQVVKLD